MKRNTLNLALAAVVAGLGLALYLGQKKPEAGPPITSLKPDEVTHVVIDHPGAPAIELAKRGGKWFIDAPVKAECDEFEINALIELASKEVKRKLEGAKLSELGLDPPAYTIKLNDRTIAFGGQEPIEFRRYVKSGDTVGLIDDPPSAALDQDYSDLVAKSLFPAGSEIERIELKNLTLAKAADGKWALTPADPKAGADQMQKLADGWKNARSMWNEFVANPAAIKGDTVKVTLKGGIVREFVVAATDPQLKLFRPDLKVNLVLSKALADEILKLPAPKAEPKPAAATGAASTPEQTPAPAK